MQKHLYFICPTDQLEMVIDEALKQESYYCTSLGNSITFDADMMEQLNELLKTRDIKKISFILSDDNRIILDALGKKRFSAITGLNHFYNEIVEQKKHSELSWQIRNRQFLILSYHLNNKIKELKLGLESRWHDHLFINGKIYNRQRNNFRDIYSDLICREYFNLN